MREYDSRRNMEEEILRAREIKRYYDYFVDTTIDFIKSYDLTTPLEIYCLFNLINENYVKADEVYKILCEKEMTYLPILELKPVQGILTLVNGGVCRHRAEMLDDIYNKMGFDSNTLSGNLTNLLMFQYGNSQNKQTANRIYVAGILDKISKGDKIEYYKNNLKRRKISYTVKEVHDDYFYKNEDLKKSNHRIVVVGDSERYYLDPMNDVTYYKADNDVVTLRTNTSLYFFTDRENMDSKIMSLPIASNSKTTSDISRIYSYLKRHRGDIKDFADSNYEKIQEVREKMLFLSK